MPVGRSGPLPREDVAADDLLTIQDIGPDRLAQGGLVARPDRPYRRLVPVDDISGPEATDDHTQEWANLQP